MTEVRDQRSAVEIRGQKLTAETRSARSFFSAPSGPSVVKSISDLRVLIFGLCALLFALSVPVMAQPFRNNGDISARIHLVPKDGTFICCHWICDGYVCDGSRRIKGTVVNGHSQRTTSGERTS